MFNAWTYSLWFVFILTCLPFILYEVHKGSAIYLALSIINLTLFICVSYFIHSQELAAWEGLRLLCSCFMSGCANITILYIFFVLFCYYILAVIKTFQGFCKGREFTQKWWVETVYHLMR